MDPATTAVVLVEFQNDFTTEGGVLHGAVQAVMESTGMLDTTAGLVEAARDQGATIIHSPIQFAKGYHEITKHPYGILAGVVATNAFVKDAWGAAFSEQVSPAADDIVLEGKRGLDAFEVVTLTDCLAATSQAEHDNAIQYDYPMFSKPMASGEFLDALGGAAAGEDTSRGY